MHRSLLPSAALALALLGAPAAAQAVFDVMDTDQDGFVSRAEMDAERAARFAALDRDGDGFVSRPEMIAGPGNGRAGYKPEETQAMLAAYDLDGDGRVSSEEVQDSLARTDVFVNMDTNGDGLLDREEASAALDTRPRAAPAAAEIVAELAQGARTRGGFSPLRQPATPGTIAAYDPSLPPGVAAALDATAPPVAVDVGPSWSDRSGYVARSVDPVAVHSSAQDAFYSGAVPPGPAGGTPLRVDDGAFPLQGPNWRVVDDAQGLAPIPAPRQPWLQRVLGGG